MGAFKETLLKAHCAQALARLNLEKNKKLNLSAMEKKEAVANLRVHKLTLARIKQEQALREEYVIEAYEILKTYLELIKARTHIIAAEKMAPPMMVEAIETVIWCSAVSEVKEFQSIAKDFKEKYGKSFVRHALENKHGNVDPFVQKKLNMQLPDPTLVNQCLRTLAAQHQLTVPALTVDDEVPLPSYGAEPPMVGAIDVNRAPDMMPTHPPTVPSPHDGVNPGHAPYSNPAPYNLAPPTVGPMAPITPPGPDNPLSRAMPKSPKIDDLEARFNKLQPFEYP